MIGRSTLFPACAVPSLAWAASADALRAPQAITPISGSGILRAGITDPRYLNRRVPGREIRADAQGSSFHIRGVGSSNSNARGDAALAASLDGLYFSRPYGPTYQCSG